MSGSAEPPAPAPAPASGGRPAPGDASAVAAPGTGPSGPSGEPLRILHLAAPVAVGGAESVIRLLAAGMRRRGHDARVLAVVEPDAELGPFREGLEEAGVPLEVRRLPARAYLREARAVVRSCRRLRPHVVHSHGFRSDVVAAVTRPFTGRALVSTVHGWISSSWKIRLYEGIQRLALRSFDRVVAVSRPLEDRLVDGGIPERRTRLVPNAYRGGPDTLDREAALRALGVPDDAFHVGFVGRLSPEKGPDVLLDALAGLGEVPWRASFLGEGPGREGLEARARELGIADRVRFHGRVPRASRLFRAFDVFALSSRTEGTPMVLLEAMDAGVPVVATRVGGVPDVTGSGTALLVPPEDPEALSRAIRRVRADPDAARQRARKARRRLETTFGLDRWLERYESVYRQARNERTASP